MRICVSPYTPYVFCDPARAQDTYSGYYVDVFRALAQRVEWLADFDSWFFDCVSVVCVCLFCVGGVGMPAAGRVHGTRKAAEWLADFDSVFRLRERQGTAGKAAVEARECGALSCGNAVAPRTHPPRSHTNAHPG